MKSHLHVHFSRDLIFFLYFYSFRFAHRPIFDRESRAFMGPQTHAIEGLFLESPVLAYTSAGLPAQFSSFLFRGGKVVYKMAESRK